MLHKSWFCCLRCAATPYKLQYLENVYVMAYIIALWLQQPEGWRHIVCACAEAVMTSSSNYDIRRNLIDAPSSDSQLPVVGGSDLALSGPGMEDRRSTLRGCALRSVPRALSQDSLSIKYRRLVRTSQLQKPSTQYTNRRTVFVQPVRIFCAFLPAY